MNGSYRQGDVVLGNWTLGRKIGEGSFGQVFEAIREDFGVTYRAAIKIITIPQSESEIKSARSEGLDDGSITGYFRSFVEEIVQEFVLMSKLKGNSHIVSYEDHTVLEHQDRIGWDIIIRMELLTPLLDAMQKQPMTQQDVVKLGVDITKALELCQKHNIVHRDIKPENIFVSDAGDYKLGDFGIARTVEKTTGGLSKKGTYTYMAPEVYKDEPYGASVDLYSLGLVMYRLLNGNRAPFLPPYPAPISHSDRENAMVQRMSGARIPAPSGADARLAQIVLRACAYQPRERYAGPAQMRGELEALGSAAPQDQASAPPNYGPAEATSGVFGSTQAAPQPNYGPAEATSGVFGGTQAAPQSNYGPAEATSGVFGGTQTAAQPEYNPTERTSSVFGGQAVAGAGAYQSPPNTAADSGGSDRTEYVFSGRTAPQAAAPVSAPTPKKKKSALAGVVRWAVGVALIVIVGAVVRSVFFKTPEPANDVPQYFDVPEVDVSTPEEDLAIPEPMPAPEPEDTSNSKQKPASPTVEEVPDDIFLKLPEFMAVGTRASVVLRGESSFPYVVNADGAVSSDPDVIVVEEGALYAAAPGTAEITLTYGGKTFSGSVTVAEINASSGATLTVVEQETDSTIHHYAVNMGGAVPQGWHMYVYSLDEGASAFNLQQQEDGSISLDVSVFEGITTATIMLLTGDDAEVVALCTFEVDGGF